jgi:hypothetical protein
MFVRAPQTEEDQREMVLSLPELQFKRSVELKSILTDLFRVFTLKSLIVEELLNVSLEVVHLH